MKALLNKAANQSFDGPTHSYHQVCALLVFVSYWWTSSSKPSKSTKAVTLREHWYANNFKLHSCPALPSTVHGYSWEAPPTYMGVYYSHIVKWTQSSQKHAFVTGSGVGWCGGRSPSPLEQQGSYEERLGIPVNVTTNLKASTTIQPQGVPCSESYKFKKFPNFDWISHGTFFIVPWDNWWRYWTTLLIGWLQFLYSASGACKQNIKTFWKCQSRVN